MGIIKLFFNISIISQSHVSFLSHQPCYSTNSRFYFQLMYSILPIFRKIGSVGSHAITKKKMKIHNIPGKLSWSK